MDTKPENTEMLDLFKTLGDAERLKIVGLLANESLPLTAIAERLALKPGEAAGHLEHLEEMGLVVKEDTGYRLNTGSMETKVRAVLSQNTPRTRPDDFEGDEFERKTLANYFSPTGKLKSIPTQQKKLLVILRYLAKQFQPGERYPEKQVNDILWRYHNDTAALRRYMVDNGLMARDKGIYWRTEA